MTRIAKRFLLAFVCLILAPLVAVSAGLVTPNPSGHGVGLGRLVVGGAVAVCLSLNATVSARVGGWREACGQSRPLS
jgi:hypothetical protein